MAKPVFNYGFLARKLYSAHVLCHACVDIHVQRALNGTHMLTAREALHGRFTSYPLGIGEALERCLDGERGGRDHCLHGLTRFFRVNKIPANCFTADLLDIVERISTDKKAPEVGAAANKLLRFVEIHMHVGLTRPVQRNSPASGTPIISL